MPTRHLTEMFRLGIIKLRTCCMSTKVKITVLMNHKISHHLQSKNSFLNIMTTIIIKFNNISISRDGSGFSNTQKHSISQCSDHKLYKKHKSSLYSSQSGDQQDSSDITKSSQNKNHSSQNLKSINQNTSTLPFNFSPAHLNASLSTAGTIPNIFNTSLSQTKAGSALNSNMPLLDGDPNALKSQLFDGDFMRLAATNPLFRFSDFGSMANNPYFKNLFRSQVCLILKTNYPNSYNLIYIYINRLAWMAQVFLIHSHLHHILLL